MLERLQTADEELLCRVAPGIPPLPGTDAARIQDFDAEFAMGFNALARVEKGVSIFGSARTPEDDPDYALAREATAHLGRSGFDVITGGGGGIMEAANRGARDVGALSVGCNIELPFEQIFNRYVDLRLTFRHFFVRKVMFVRYATGFVVFPGGFGTLDELFEALTLIQTRKVRHFPVVLVGTDYWRELVCWVEKHLAATGKIAPSDGDLLRVTDNPQEVCATVQTACAKQRELYCGDTV